jgi:hypothetical protein
LVQVDRAGEQTSRQIKVGQDQMGRVHPSQRRHPHPGVGRARKGIFGELSAVGEHERIRLGGDREGVLEHRMREVHRGVAQADLRCR